MAFVEKGVPWNLDLDIGMSFCLDIFAVVQKNHVVKSSLKTRMVSRDAIVELISLLIERRSRLCKL